MTKILVLLSLLLTLAVPAWAISPECAAVAVGATLVDWTGNTWTITTAAQVAENGIVDTSTSNVAMLVFSGGFIYQQNVAGAWYRRTATTAWTSTAAPVCAMPPPPIPTSTPTPGPPWRPAGPTTVSGTTDITVVMSSSAVRTNIYLDNLLVASTPPADWLWDTTSVANGSHMVRVDDIDKDGAVIGTTSMNVMVSN